jgi:hypothetical protein
VLCQDAAADLAAAVARAIPPQLNQSETQLLTAVLDAVATDARPPSVFDTALDTYKFAYDNVGDGTVALGLIQDATMSAVGATFIDARGQLRYVNRQTEAAQEPAITIGAGDLIYRGPGFAGASSLRNVFNRVRMTIHPKTIAAATLFRSDAKIELGPGVSVEVWDSYSDPNTPGRLIGGYNFVALVAGTDYSAHANPDGSGADVTSALTVAITPFVSSAKSVLTNVGVDILYVTLRQLRGSGIFDDAPVTLETFRAKPYGDRPASIELPFQDNALVAQNLADFFVAQYSDRAYAGDMLTYDPQRRDALMQAALTLDIGAVITASEVQTGVNDMHFVIRSIAYAFEPVQDGAFLLVQYTISPHITSTAGMQAWIFDHPKRGLLDTGTVFGFA